MDYLFINPPSFTPAILSLPAIPELMGILEKHHYNSFYIDLNADFVNKIFNSNLLSEIYNKFENIKENRTKYTNEYNEIIVSISYDDIETLKQFCNKKAFYYAIFNNVNLFFKPLLLAKAIKELVKVLKLISRPNSFFLEKLVPEISNYRTSYINPEYKLEINSILEYFNSDICVIKPYIESKINEILEFKTKGIGITINTIDQLIPGLLLCYILKNKYQKNVNIGGSFFNMSYKHITNLNEILEFFTNSISIKDNKNTVIDIIENIQSKREINDIENIIHLENKNVVINKERENKEKNYLVKSSFNGFNNIKYLTPKNFLSVMASEGCYWNKCIFCMNSNTNTKYKIKPVKIFVDELEYLSKKHNTNFFLLWDNVIPIKYLEEMSQEILNRKLKITYSFYSRFEKEYNYKLLKQLYKSGCIEIIWGLESGSEKILNAINKGIRLKDAYRILKEAKKAKISNSITLILGLPYENVNDMEETYKFIKKLKNKIQFILVTTECMFREGSIITDNREFYKSKIYTNSEERNKICSKILKEQNEYYKNLFMFKVHYLTYIEKFGLNGLNRKIILSKLITFNQKVYDTYINIYYLGFKIKKVIEGQIQNAKYNFNL